ncbi:MAG: hypothetical protein ABIR66_01200 [Saprospiraceae bacterium]
MNRMQNKSSMLSSLKQREDAGWKKLHQQLDVDLPVKKEWNKKLFWIFLFGSFGLGAFLWGIRTFQPSGNKSGIQSILSNDSINNTFNSKKPIDREIASFLTEGNNISKPGKEKIDESGSITLNKSVKNELIKYNDVAAFEDKNNSNVKNKNDHPTLGSTVENIVSSPIIHVTKKAETKLLNKDNDLPADINTKNNIAQEIATNPVSTNQKSLTENQSTISQDQIFVTRLHSKNLIQFSIVKGLPIVSLANPTDFQKTNNLVDLKKSKPSLWFVQTAAALHDATYLSSSLAPGISIHLGSKWTINTFMGIGYQFSSNKGTPINPGNNGSFANSNKDAITGSVYTQSSTQIFLDKSNGMTRLSNGSLYIAASDQILYTQAAHFNLMGQSSLSYALSSRWFIESGIYFHQALSKNYNQITVQSSSLNNSGSVNAQSTMSRFNVYTSNIPLDFHFIFQAGYRLNKKIDVNLCYSPRSFSTIYPGNNLLYDAAPSGVPQVASVSAFVLPNKDGTSFARFAIRYHL